MGLDADILVMREYNGQARFAGESAAEYAPAGAGMHDIGWAKETAAWA
jgi:hypothetical protein